MSSFFSYSTNDPNTGNQPLAANDTLDGDAFQTGTSAKVVGSVFSDQPGTLLIQQSMDYSAVAPTSGQAEPTVYWDIVDSFTIAAGVPQKIDVDIIGPVARVVYENGANQQGALRIFLRAIGNRAAS